MAGSAVLVGIVCLDIGASNECLDTPPKRFEAAPAACVMRRRPVSRLRNHSVATEAADAEVEHGVEHIEEAECHGDGNGGHRSDEDQQRDDQRAQEADAGSEDLRCLDRCDGIA